MAWKIVVPLGLLKYGTLTDVTVCYEYSFSIYAHMNPFSLSYVVILFGRT